MAEVEYQSNIRLVVSAGHAEYFPAAVGGMTAEWLWPGEIDTFDMAEEDLPKMWAELYPNIPVPDADLGWESICLIRGSHADVEAWLAQLLMQIGDHPSGDDDVFDYWPSGVRLALDVADRLGAAPAGAPLPTWTQMVEHEAREVISEFGEFADELLGKCGLL